MAHFKFNSKVDVVVTIVLFDGIIPERVPVQNMSNYQVVDLKRHLRNVSHMLGGCHCNLEQRCMNVNWFSIYGRCQVLCIMQFHKLKLAKRSHVESLVLSCRTEAVDFISSLTPLRFDSSQARGSYRSQWDIALSGGNMNGLHFPDIPSPNTGECCPPPLSPCVLSTTPLNIFPSIYLSFPPSISPVACADNETMALQCSCKPL